VKFVIDAMGAPERSGGMRMYAEEIVKTWAEVFPEDDLIVIGNPWILESFAGLRAVKLRVVRNDSAWSRVWTQLIGSAITYYRQRADILLSISTIVSPLVMKHHRACIVHDWRHIKNPGEFGAAQRLYRQLWVLSARSSGTVICISAKTLTETRAYAKGANALVVSNGGDHARRWPVAAPTITASPVVVTFGHHANKRPELAISAVAHLIKEGIVVRLEVLGAAGDLAEDLKALCLAEGISEYVSFPGFVSESTYEAIIQNADIVALVSTDEGFGLPVAEARYFGIPCVVTADNGLSRIHGGSVIESRPSPIDLASAIQVALGVKDSSSNRAALPTWADTAKGIREAIVQLRRTAEMERLS